MGIQSINNIIKELRKESSEVLVREVKSYSWCKELNEAIELFEQIFKAVDSTGKAARV